MMFRMCHAFKMSPWEVMEMTVREISFLLGELREFEMREQANKLSLAGGDGQAYLAAIDAEKSMEDAEFEDDDKLEELIKKDLASS